MKMVNLSPLLGLTLICSWVLSSAQAQRSKAPSSYRQLTKFNASWDNATNNSTPHALRQGGQWECKYTVIHGFRGDVLGTHFGTGNTRKEADKEALEIVKKVNWSYPAELRGPECKGPDESRDKPIKKNKPAKIRERGVRSMK